MQKLSLTALRQKLFKVADRVLHTGVPVAINRRGRRLLLAPDGGTSRLAHLRRRKLIKGDPESLVGLKVSEWREPRNLG